MKLNRDQLKSLIKECLAEILTEGLGDQLNKTQLMESNSNVSRAVNHQKRMQAYGSRPSPNLKNAIKHSSGGDPMMESILSDTARTTLVQQTAAGDSLNHVSTSRPTGLQQQEQFVGEPEQVFGQEASSKWADLAFATPNSKKFT